MPFDWTIAGWIVAVGVLLVAAFQLITSHYQTEKGFTREDLKEWNLLIEPLLEFLDKMERQMAPLGMAELPSDQVSKIKRKMKSATRSGFEVACENYENARETAELGDVDIFLDYSAQGKDTMKAAISKVRNCLLSEHP